MAQTPTIDRFLSEISVILRERDSSRLREYLIIEPPYGDLYTSMIGEIRSSIAKDGEIALEDKCSAQLPEARDGDEGATWTPFIKFMVQYFGFLRDVNVENLLETYNLLSELVQKCNSALGHPTLGVLVLPTVITYSKMLSKLAIGLDRKPELIAHLIKRSTEDGGARETLPERAANIIRHAFVTCLNDRTAGTAGKPGGKKIGVYRIANVCLKVLFQCRKTQNAEQIFTNIYAQSPPLSLYPRSERVTYLYYLGRFFFSTNHFFRAHLALQTAYNECHVKCMKQRRLILIYLMATNIILGRFPSETLYQRPEAAGLAEKFRPICNVIKKGDLESFQRLFDMDDPNTHWLLSFRICLQLKNRCKVLVWRSLVRQVFLLRGSQGDAEARRAPTFNLVDIMHVAQFLERRALAAAPSSSGEQRSDDTLEIYVDPDFDGVDHLKTRPRLTNLLGVESVLSSLVQQGLLNGFISHRLHRFAIQGAKRRGALAAGFPNVWQTIKSSGENEIPGWRLAQSEQDQGSFGGGNIVHLSNARPIGA